MSGKTGGNRGRWRAAALAVATPWLASAEEVGDTEIVHALAPGATIREVLIPSSHTVADVALSIRQDTRRRDRGTGQLEAGS